MKNLASIVLKIIIILSIPFLTLLISNMHEAQYIIIGVICAFIVGIIIGIIKRKSKIPFDIKKLIISLVLSLSFVKQELTYVKGTDGEKIMQELFFHFNLPLSPEKIVGVLALPAAIFIIYICLVYLLPKAYGFFKSFNKTEKIYMTIVSILGIAISVITIETTSAYSYPIYKGEAFIRFDAIYTSDSGDLTENLNTFYNPSYTENDIRQPLFGIFALPFSIPIKFISSLMFFIEPEQRAMGLLLTMTQFILLGLTTIMLARIMKLSNKEKIYFYILISLSFPYLLFSTVLEQYVIGLFYLILTIYLYFTKKDGKPNYSYIGAVGTLICSGIIFPLISNAKKIKKIIVDTVKCFFVFCAVAIIGGQLPQLFTINETWNSLTEYSTGITFSDKLYQYTNFVKEIFFANPGMLSYKSGMEVYRLAEFKAVSIIGIIIMALCVVSFIINRKDKVSRISFWWILYSFVILAIIGWGTSENGLVLYSLYFAWAFIVLIYNLLRKVENKKIIFNILFIALIAIMVYCNFSEILNIYNFAVQYYGVR